MSSFTTKEISRTEAEALITKIVLKQLQFNDKFDHEIEDILNEYAHSGEHQDVIGHLYNFSINNNGDNESKIKLIEKIANNILLFDDESDFGEALWVILETINQEKYGGIDDCNDLKYID